MSKVLIILCLAIVPSMVSSEAATPPSANVVSAATFVKNLITDESMLCSDEFVAVNSTMYALLNEVYATTNTWYIETTKKFAYIWINNADWFVSRQANGEAIPQNCVMIQQNLFDYGTLVGQKLSKCAMSQRLIGQRFYETLKGALLPYYSQLKNLGVRAKNCQLNPDLGSTFTCLLKVMLDFFVLPNPKIALHRQLFAAQTHAATLTLQLENCPYLANMVEFESRALQAVFDINACLYSAANPNNIGK